jgi:hypothetical protein
MLRSKVSCVVGSQPYYILVVLLITSLVISIIVLVLLISRIRSTI